MMLSLSLEHAKEAIAWSLGHGSISRKDDLSIRFELFYNWFRNEIGENS